MKTKNFTGDTLEPIHPDRDREEPSDFKVLIELSEFELTQVGGASWSPRIKLGF